MNKIQYNRRSLRLKSHDYSHPGAYFVTICAYNRECLFGNIAEGKIIFKERGNIVDHCWREIPAHFPQVELDGFVIMPNHIHGIIWINNSAGAGFPRPNVENAKCNIIGRGDRAPTLGQIVAYFKYEAAKQVNKLRNTPGVRFWQRNYYEHIVRDDTELNHIRQYIIENPLRWDMDSENPNNIRDSLLPRFTPVRN